MAREDAHFRLRLPEDLHDRLRVVAAVNRRSITAEVVARLVDSFAREDILGADASLADLRKVMRGAMADMLGELRADPAILRLLLPEHPNADPDIRVEHEDVGS